MIRLLVATDDEGERHRLSRLLRQRKLDPAIIFVGTAGSVQARLIREDYDLLLVAADLLPSHPERFVEELQALPEHPGVIVLARKDVPRHRAALLASGCDAVLWLGLDDETLGQALTALVRPSSSSSRLLYRTRRIVTGTDRFHCEPHRE